MDFLVDLREPLLELTFERLVLLNGRLLHTFDAVLQVLRQVFQILEQVLLEKVISHSPPFVLFQINDD